MVCTGAEASITAVPTDKPAYQYTRCPTPARRVECGIKTPNTLVHRRIGLDQIPVIERLAMSSDGALWYASSKEIISFAKILVAGEVLLSADDAIEYFEEPWNRTHEFDMWEHAGRPRPPSTADLAEARMCGSGPRADELNQAYSEAGQKWDAFVVVLDAYEYGEAPLAALPTPGATGRTTL